jgi:hypothetical protein
MRRALFIGQQPETVDFSDPAIPPGFNAEKIHAGIAIAMAKMAERGLHADLCLIPPGEEGSRLVQKQLCGAVSRALFGTRPGSGDHHEDCRAEARICRSNDQKHGWK